MEHTTQIKGLTGKDKFVHAVKTRSYPLYCFFYGSAGFIAALGRILGDPAPFGIALTAAAALPELLPCALGAALGYLSGLGAQSYPQIGTLLILTALRRIMAEKVSPKDRQWLTPCTAAACTFLFMGLRFALGTHTLYGAVYWIAQTVLTGVSAIFFSRGILTLRKKHSIHRQLNFFSLVISISLLGLGLDHMAFGGVSAGRILASATILFTAYAGGEEISVLTGVICGVFIGFSTGNFPLYITAYSLGGLLSGLFSAFGRTGSILSFCATWGVISMLSEGSFTGLLSVVLGSLLFACIPHSQLRIASRWLSQRSADGDTVRAITESRLGEISNAMQEVCGITRKVATRLQEISGQSREELSDQVCRKICSSCPRNAICWTAHYSDSQAALSGAFSLLFSAQPLTVGYFSERLSDCRSADALLSACKEQYWLYLTREEQRRRAQRMRGLVTDQFDGLSLTLDGIAAEISQLTSGDSVLAARLDALFRESHIEPDHTICWRGPQGHLICAVTIPPYKSSRLRAPELRDEIYEICGIHFDEPILREKGHLDRYFFYEKPLYYIEHAVCQLPAGAQTCCGDTLRVLADNAGYAHLVLSDGMGTGKNAAVDSAMASSLLMRLLAAGVSCDGALKLVNAALLVKSEAESLATIDAIQIDLYSGKARFYKAGAAPTFLLHASHAVTVDSASLPAGILAGVNFTHSELLLLNGDLIVLCSDGAASGDYDWICRMMEESATQPPEQIARLIAESARVRGSSPREDDITVCVCAVHRYPESLPAKA